MKKLIIILCLFILGCINKVSEGNNPKDLPDTKCLDGIVHYEYHFTDEVGIRYYFYVPKPDRETKFYKLCD